MFVADPSTAIMCFFFFFRCFDSFPTVQFIELLKEGTIFFAGKFLNESLLYGEFVKIKIVTLNEPEKFVINIIVFATVIKHEFQTIWLIDLLRNSFYNVV